jgi:type II secretory ATPase GspE/PulE/Tfp pilus assembly ATPase PilB-like protein
MMPLSEEIRALIMERASSGRIRRVALEQGMRSLRTDGWRLVHEGVTTVGEVVFATKEEANMAAIVGAAS